MRSRSCPAARQLVSAAGDRTVKIWDVSTGKRLFTVNDSLDAVYTAAVHPSGRGSQPPAPTA